MTEDHDLLHQYATTRSDAPFAELVRRHVDLVYSAALRQTNRNVHLAQEVTQMVFTDLARKAGSINRRTILIGWLHTAVRFAASKAVRSATRRERHERAAAVDMNEAAEATEALLDPDQLQPVIDVAIGKLKPREREAVLMRFFESRDFAEVGTRLAISESAARSCVDRALRKMRASLEGLGVRSSTAALSLALSQQSTVAAPVDFAVAVCANATAAASHSVAPAALLFLSMTKTNYALIGALTICSGLGVAVAVRLADRERELEQLRPQAMLATEVRKGDLAFRKGSEDTSSTPAISAPVVTAARVSQNTPAAPSAVSSRNILEDLVKVEEIQNQGAATPAAAFQTIVWAAMQGQTDALAKVLVLEPSAVELGEAYLRQLPPQQRSTYKSANHLVALITEKEVLEKGSKMLILDTKLTGESKASVSVLLSDTDKGRKHPYVKEIHLVRVGNQWGLPIRKEVVESTIKRLRENTP